MDNNIMNAFNFYESKQDNPPKKNITDVNLDFNIVKNLNKREKLMLYKAFNSSAANYFDIEGKFSSEQLNAFIGGQIPTKSSSINMYLNNNKILKGSSITEPPPNNAEYYGDYFLFAKQSENTNVRFREKHDCIPNISYDSTNGIFIIEVPSIEEDT